MTLPHRIPALPYPVQAELTLPGSKSQANRAILCAALADGVTTVSNATPCDDVAVMVENLQKMGFDLEWENKEMGMLRICSGLPTSSKLKAQSSKLFCGNAGTTLRFLTALACIVPGSWTVTGDEHMCRRPIADLTRALRSLGAAIEDTNGCPPVRIKGGSLHGGRVKLKAAISSQYLTALLLVAPRLKEGLQVELDGPLASEGYVDLTTSVMADFGIRVHVAGSTFQVRPSSYRACPHGYAIEGDWSAAGVWLVLNALTGSRVSFSNLDPHSEQSDRLLGQVIERMKGRGAITIDASLVPDQVMNLAVLAAFREGETTIIGTKNLRYKETNRLEVLTSELRKAGVDIVETEDGVTVRPPSPPRGRGEGRKGWGSVLLDPHGDHRMVMCFTLLGLLRGGIAVGNPECVVKSYPGFFRDLQEVLRSPKPIAVVGMRGVGKSNFGRRLASRLKLKSVDADREFEKQFGPIRPFVESRGWQAFRAREEEVVASLLKPGVVLSCGGGVVESAKTRRQLRERSVGIWVDAPERELVKRLRNGKRPPLTNLPLEEEVRLFLKKRAPLYREVAAIHVPPRLRFSRQVPYVIVKLRELVTTV